MRRILICALLLAGCAGVPAVDVVCPPVVEYDAEFRERAAVEIESLPAGSAVLRLVEDYAALRAAARACRG